jgi:hypothetical protein
VKNHLTKIFFVVKFENLKNIAEFDDLSQLSVIKNIFLESLKMVFSPWKANHFKQLYSFFFK